LSEPRVDSTWGDAIFSTFMPPLMASLLTSFSPLDVFESLVQPSLSKPNSLPSSQNPCQVLSVGLAPVAKSREDAGEATVLPNQALQRTGWALPVRTWDTIRRDEAFQTRQQSAAGR
jgi:hypothetical protein